MKSWQKVFISVFLGNYLGGLMAIELGYLWFLGAIAGGVIGYIVRLLCDPGKIIYAVQEAWRGAIGWKPNKQWWKAAVLAICGCLSITLSVVAIIVIMVAMIPAPDSGIADAFYALFMSSGAKFAWCFIFTASIMVAMFISFVHPYSPGTLQIDLSFLEKVMANEQGRKLAWRLIFLWNPPVVLFRIIFYVVLGFVLLARETTKAVPWLLCLLIINAPRAIWRAIKATGRFIKFFFIFIHSELNSRSKRKIAVKNRCKRKIIQWLAIAVF